MIEFNDSNADVTKNGISIFFDPVDTDDDVYIGSSCIFMDDFHTSGSLKAQYSLTVHGSLSVDGKLQIGEDLTCASLVAEDVDIERNLSVREDINVQRIFIGGNADIGNIFAHTVTAYGNVFVREWIDIQGDMEANMAVIGLDYISVSGTLKCAYAVSQSIDAGNNQVGNVTIAEQIKPASELAQKNDGESILPIAESEIKDIFDGNSHLAVGMEDFALLLDKLNENLCQMEITDGNLLKYLDAYGGFIPSYMKLHDVIGDSITTVVGNLADGATQFKNLLTCGQALILFPEWFRDSLVANRYKKRFKEILESLIRSERKTTRSKSEWMQGQGLVEQFKEQYPEEEVICSFLDVLSGLLFRNTGLKSLSVKIYLPEE